MGNADGGHTENGDPHRRNDKADHGGNGVPARHLSQMDRENQVPCTKHHAKEHGSQKEILSTGQLFHEVLLMDRN